MDTMRTIVPRIRAEYPSLEQRSDRHERKRPPTLGQWIAWILQGFKVQRTRRALRQLTDDELRDIGLRPDEAAREAKRPIWDRNTPFDRWG
ncbi:hypothetical protein ATN84_08875 [Paramesorhizobium deserti]|uniref:YjiS-like domain-containing protein n=1 Tax=Paramesorhizobium deserti TaxID=1494590 RepID=A0A135HWA4_9HYPH|nr:hypothetical protein ATN84_08875 [Paramesorhizobium deserti]